MQTKKNKVLLLPSFYPTIKNPIIGSQVYEQTILLSDEFEFKVLFCLPGMGWKRFIVYYLFELVGISKYNSCNESLMGNMLDVNGIYYFNSKYFTYKKNTNLRIKAYKYLLNDLIRKGWKPDLIHARTAEYAGVHAAYLAKSFNIPFLLTENCSFLITENISVNRIKSYKYAIESADMTAVVSNYLKSFLLTNNFKCEPKVIGNLVDESVFNIQEKKTDIFTIVSIGYASYIKDWQTFFKAIEYLINFYNVKDFIVKICITQVYDEYSKNYFSDQLKQYNIAEYCQLLFEVPRIEISKVFQNSNVFVSTSISETFGIACVEAMFCGIPVVATDNGGINDYINEQNGIKVLIRDYIGIANGILSIKNEVTKFDPNLIRSSVLNKYSTINFKDQLSHLYRNTINSITQ